MRSRLLLLNTRDIKLFWKIRSEIGVEIKRRRIIQISENCYW